MTIFSVEVTAARQLSQQATTAFRGALPATFAGLLTVAPGASITLVLGTRAHSGAGHIGLLAEAAGALSRQLATELASELDQAFGTAVNQAKRVVPTRHWAVAPTPRVALGFGDQGSLPGEAAQQWRAPEGHLDHVAELSSQWLALCSEYPGLQLALTFRFDALAPRARAFSLTATVCFTRAKLPLRARALLERMLPGLSVAAAPGGLPTTVQSSCDDAMTLLQLPLASPDPLPGIPVAAARPITMLPSAQGEVESGVRIGLARLPSGRTAEVRLSRTELVRHTHVLGKTGAGKSTVLAAMMHGLALEGGGFLLIDPHGDLYYRVIAELPQSALKRTWAIDAGDYRNPVPINLLSTVDPVQLDIVIQDLILIFYKLFDPKQTGIVGPRFESFLTNALRGLRELRGPRASLLDVPRLYRDRRIERAVALAVTDPQLQGFWRHEMPQLSESNRSEIVGWVTSKFDRFSNTVAMRGILGTGADAFDPAAVMDEGRIILVNLAKGKLGEVASNMLGFLYLTRFGSSMMARTNRNPFGIIVDEAHSFSAGSLPTMLSEGRKFGVAVTLAHQHLSQLEPSLAESLEGNVATTIAFRTGPRDALEVAKRMGGGVSVAAITTQPDLSAIVSRTSGLVLPRPHTLVVDHNHRVAARSGLELARFSAELRARTYRDLVDPFRSLTPFAPLVEPEPRRTAAPKPVVASRTAIDPASAKSFLDEWLERRFASGPGGTSEPATAVVSE